MITAYSNGDIKYRAIEEQKILGKVLQILADYHTLDPVTLKPMERNGGAGLEIELQPLSHEDKQKIWSVPNKALLGEEPYVHAFRVRIGGFAPIENDMQGAGVGVLVAQFLVVAGREEKQCAETGCCHTVYFADRFHRRPPFLLL